MILTFPLRHRYVKGDWPHLIFWRELEVASLVCSSEAQSYAIQRGGSCGVTLVEEMFQEYIVDTMNVCSAVNTRDLLLRDGDVGTVSTTALI